MKIFGVDPVNDFNWYFIWYTLTAIAFVVVGTQNLASTGMTSAVIYAIGSSLVFINFGLHWFGKAAEGWKSWPPIINMCPDYLTYVPSLPGCVDMLGVTSKSAGLLRTLPSEINNVTLGDTNKVFEYTSADVKSASGSSALKAICDRCKNAGVTWEGVYDGDTCVGIQTQVAKKAAIAALPNRCLVESDDIMGPLNKASSAVTGSTKSMMVGSGFMKG